MLLRGAFGQRRCATAAGSADGNARSGEKGRARADPGADVESLFAGRTGSSAAQDTTGRKNGHRRRRAGLVGVTRYLSQWPARIRNGERGVMGAPRSRQTHVTGGPDRDRPSRRPRRPCPSGCYGSSIPPTSISVRATTTSASRRAPSVSGSSPHRTAAVDLALAEKVDLFLIAGDLFDSNVQPKRSVERVAAQLQRLAASKIRTVIRARTTATTAVDLSHVRPGAAGAVPPPTIS